jgi:type 1 glutamine amidotransferase
MKSIKLGNNTYVHVFLHQINVTLEEAVISSETWDGHDYEEQANQYIDALEDHHCVAFLEELHKVCAQRIVQHWEEFAPNQLKEKRNKQYLKFKKEDGKSK